MGVQDSGETKRAIPAEPTMNTVAKDPKCMHFGTLATTHHRSHYPQRGVTQPDLWQRRGVEELRTPGSTPSNPGRWGSSRRPLKKRFPIHIFVIIYHVFNILHVGSLTDELSLT